MAVAAHHPTSSAVETGNWRPASRPAAAPTAQDVVSTGRCRRMGRIIARQEQRKSQQRRPNALPQAPGSKAHDLGGRQA
jgi:hypothetical protein